jgi:2,3-bisphosphoglycerate-dependent phosphoglycerate mutase
MLIGHRATYRALEHVINGLTVQELVAAEFEWRAEGCNYPDAELRADTGAI